MSEKFSFEGKHFWPTEKTKEECNHMAILANAILDAHLARLPKYYGRNKHCFTDIVERHDTQQALIWSIEPLEKKECVEHVPTLASKQVAPMPFADDPFGASLLLGCAIECAKCGAKLKATWSAE